MFTGHFRNLILNFLLDILTRTLTVNWYFILQTTNTENIIKINKNHISLNFRETTTSTVLYQVIRLL